MSYIIKARYLREAQTKCLQKIIKEDITAKDAKEGTIKEILNMVVDITNPLRWDKFVKNAVESRMIKWMQKNFFGQNIIPDWGYNYGQRLFNYNKINQIKTIINKLKTDPAAKSATITLMKPGFDLSHVPCLVGLDFKIRNGRLLLTGFFRSQDIYNKMYADLFCLAKIQKKVAGQLNIRVGILSVYIVSAHIYGKDLMKAKERIRKNR